MDKKNSAKRFVIKMHPKALKKEIRYEIGK